MNAVVTVDEYVSLCELGTTWFLFNVMQKRVWESMCVSSIVVDVQ